MRLPVRNVLAVEVDEGGEQLPHNHGCFFLGEVLAVEDEVEELATLAVLKHKEAHVVPLPDLVQFDYVWVVLNNEKLLARELHSEICLPGL